MNTELIATLPSVADEKAVRAMFENPSIDAVRLNTGAYNPFDELSTVQRLMAFADAYGKDLWIDLKARQLRVVRWADPDYRCIELNHNISCSPPAKVLLRGEEPLTLVFCEDNRIVVSPPPRHAVGCGQSVNILSEGLRIFENFTPQDIRYLDACRALGHKKIMLSYVESTEDAKRVQTLLPGAELICKLETTVGCAAAEELSAAGYGLMAARDHLFLEMEGSPKILAALKRIAACDQRAVCASRVFSSLERDNKVSLSDYEDLMLMTHFGYRRFMLCDAISGRYLDQALDAWKRFIDDL